MTIVTLSPSASNHDAHQANNGTMSVTTTTVQIGATQWGGLYVSSSIPAQSTINSATLYFIPSTTDYDTAKVTWYGQAADTAGVFTTTAYNISSRSRTTASVSQDATDIKDGDNHQTLDVTSLVAEVVGRPGFTGPIVLIGDGETDSVLRFYSQNNGSLIWYLEVDYGATATHATRKLGRTRLTSKIGGTLA